MFPAAWLSGTILVAFFLACGCASDRPTGPVIPPSGIVINQPTNRISAAPSGARVPAPVVAEVAAIPEPVVVPVLPAVPLPIVPPPAVSGAALHLPGVTALTNDVSAWLRDQGWSTPHPVARGRELHYESEGPSGRLSVLVGQKDAEWNGRKMLLGFEPRMVAGKLWMHPLDIEAHLAPLVVGGPWRPEVRTIVIDPGHGGRQPGTRSILGNQFEKDFTLDWAFRLRGLLESRGWKVTLTRTNDVDLTLAERVDIAEATGAEVFLSLHFNSSFPSQHAAGLETYCLTPHGMASHVVREFPDDVGRVFPNNAHDAANLRLAVEIHRDVIASSGIEDRGVRHARFMDVLRWQNRPAVLVEGGYLSNPDEARRIQNPEFRQRLAEGVAAAFR